MTHRISTRKRRPLVRLVLTLTVSVTLFSDFCIEPASADQVDRDFQTVRQQLTGESVASTVSIDSIATTLKVSTTLSQPTAPSLLERASNGMNKVVDHALDLLGVRYHRGGRTPETGFDCSGFVTHVYRSVGTLLPRSARDISHEGEVIRKDELQPGDLVFFNTMRRAFSHVGIYLGNNQFVHAPASGGKVRIDDLREKYWGKHYNGARRVSAD